MTEAEWLSCADPRAMAVPDAVLGAPWYYAAIGPRKKRLLLVALARLLADRVGDAAARRTLDTFEEHADGRVAVGELRAARKAVEGALADIDQRLKVERPHPPHVRLYTDERAAAILLRMAGRTAAVVPLGWRFAVWEWLADRAPTVCDLTRCVLGNPYRPVVIDPSWRTEEVVGLATGTYADRAFDRLPILADALQDAGSEDEQILAHCRGPGQHVRGCWVIDLLLGKA